MLSLPSMPLEDRPRRLTRKHQRAIVSKAGSRFKTSALVQFVLGDGLV